MLCAATYFGNVLLQSDRGAGVCALTDVATTVMQVGTTLFQIERETMRFSMILCSGLALATATFASPALADDGGETAPPPALTVNGTATVVSDYRFRGISQTDKNFAIQGSITISHKSGFYASVWGSSVDGYVTAAGDYVNGTNGGQANVELDVIGGFKKTVGGTTFDIGVLYYVYPKTKLTGDPTSSDFVEPYFAVSHTFGIVSAKATVNYAPKQKALALDQGLTGLLPKNDNVYLAGDFAAGIPKTPISVSAHIAHTFGPSWLSIGNGYTDWNLGASYTWKAVTFSAQYVDTDGDFITPSGKNASKAGFVGSIGVSF